MDENHEDFEEKMEEDEVEALDEHDLLMGVGDEDDPLDDEEDEDEMLDKFGFTRDDEEGLSDF